MFCLCWTWWNLFLKLVPVQLVSCLQTLAVGCKLLVSFYLNFPDLLVNRKFYSRALNLLSSLPFQHCTLVQSKYDIWMSSENILSVCTRGSSWSLFVRYNVRSSVNRRWLIGVVFLWSRSSVFIFLSLVVAWLQQRVMERGSLLGRSFSWCQLVEALFHPMSVLFSR